MIEEIFLMVKIFLILAIFGFVKKWTGGNTMIAIAVSGILAFIFVYKYPFLGASWLIMSNLMIIIFAIWFIGLVIPK